MVVQQRSVALAGLGLQGGSGGKPALGQFPHRHPAMLWVHPLTSNQISLDVSQEPLGIHLASEASGPLPPGRIAIADSVAQPPGTLPLAPKSSMYPIRPYPARRRAAADLGPIRHLPTDTSSSSALSCLVGGSPSSSCGSGGPTLQEAEVRKRHVVVLSEQERARLHTMIGRGIAPASALTHARILLKANQGEAGPGWTDAAIGAALEVNPATVARVRARYVAAGLEAAVYRKPPARQYRRRLDGEQEARLVALTCSAPPEGHKRWTLRLLADRLVELQVVESVSYETVRQALKQTGSSRG
jgi:hypothetical protein